MKETISKDRATVLIVLVLGLTVLLISACQSGETAAAAGINEVTLAPSFQNATQATPSAASHGGTVWDYSTLVDSLRAAGAKVELAGEISQPFFAVTGKMINVSGGEVQVYEFESEIAAKEGAALVSPDGGSVGTSAISWMATPHFYQAGKLLVLYVGDDAVIADMLESALGPQLAGGSAWALTLTPSGRPGRDNR